MIFIFLITTCTFRSLFKSKIFFEVHDDVGIKIELWTRTSSLRIICIIQSLNEQKEVVQGYFTT